MRRNHHPDSAGTTAAVRGLRPFPALVTGPDPDGAIGLAVAAAELPTPIAIDYHEPSDSLIVSVNFPDGQPHNFERIRRDGTRARYSGMAGLAGVVEFVTVRSPAAGGLGGIGPTPFVPGDLFAIGHDGHISRITDDGDTVIQFWTALPGRGGPDAQVSLYIDRTGVWGGDLIAAGDDGRIWRIDGAGTGTLVADLKIRLNGLCTVPDDPARYGELAGRILAGNEAGGRIHAIDRTGATRNWTVSDETGTRIGIEDIAMIAAAETFYGIGFVTGTLVASSADAFTRHAGDILLTDRIRPDGTSGLYRLCWDFAAVQPIAERLRATGAIPEDWENIAFAPIRLGAPEAVPVPAH